MFYYLKFCMFQASQAHYQGVQSYMKHFYYLQYVGLSSSSMYGWLEYVLTKCVHLFVDIVSKHT